MRSASSRMRRAIIGAGGAMTIAGGVLVTQSAASAAPAYRSIALPDCIAEVRSNPVMFTQWDTANGTGADGLVSRSDLETAAATFSGDASACAGSFLANFDSVDAAVAGTLDGLFNWWDVLSR